MSSEATPTLGVVLTASELEGVAPTADWARWIGSERAPAAHDGAGFRTSWNDDLEQLATLGVSDLVITLEWARLWPTAQAPDVEEIEFRLNLLEKASALGIRPWACLVDGTLPGWFADDERGFTDDKARRLLWPRHVDWVGERFGDAVHGWIPMREPAQWAAWGHLVGATPPGNQRRRDMAKQTDAMAEAELEAERLLRGEGPVASHLTGRVAIGERDNVKAAPHASWLDQHLSNRWLNSLSEGDGRDAFTHVVAQLRPPIVVDGEGNWQPPPGGFSSEAFLDGLDAISDSVGDRVLIGAGDLAGTEPAGSQQTEHLQTMAAGIVERGAQGWWQTSPIDGWHWQHGFSTTPGLIDRERNPRPAATSFGQLFS